MPDDESPDPSTVLSDADVDAALSAAQAAVVTDSTVQNQRFDCCVLSNGRPWRTMVVGAPSSDLAALTMDQVVQVFNSQFPQGHFTWQFGACP